MSPMTTVILESGPNDVFNHHTDFLQQFAAREAHARVTQQRAPLSVQQHAAHRKVASVYLK
ncbi:hypothetical protein QBC46DRAFT_401260, partial [Diplogelasinospora grovesii]